MSGSEGGERATVVFPEGENRKILRAARSSARRESLNLSCLGTRMMINRQILDFGLDGRAQRRENNSPLALANFGSLTPVDSLKSVSAKA